MSHDIGDATYWARPDAILGVGELGLNLTTGDMRFGNGSTLWPSLKAVNYQTFSAASSINVKTFGAIGDGSTNDTAAIQSALNSANSFGVGCVFFPRGQYNISATLIVGSRTTLAGEGEYVSTIFKTAGGFAALSFLGVEGSQISHSGARDITVHGNNQTGVLLKLHHANTLYFDNCSFDFSAGAAIDTVDLFDSWFRGCSMRNNFSLTEPVINLRSSASASGPTSSAGATNMVWFIQCIVETFWNGAVKIARGDATGTAPNGFYFVQCKFESNQVAGDVVQIDSTVQDVQFSQMFIAATGFKGGYSTPVNGIKSAAHSSASYRDIRVTTGGTAGVVRSALDVVSADGTAVIDNVYLDGNATVSTVFFNGTSAASYDIGAVGTSGASANLTGDGSGYNRVNFQGTNAYVDGQNGQINVHGQLNAFNGAYVGGGAPLTLENDTHLQLGTGNGTKVGTATTQKLGFYNATPIVQPSGTPVAATDLATALTLVNNLRTKLLALGIVA
jgi:hypothetical protein